MAYDSFYPVHDAGEWASTFILGMSDDRDNYIHSVTIWCRKSGGTMKLPSGSDFLATHLIVADDSTTKNQRWSGGSLVDA